MEEVQYHVAFLIVQSLPFQLPCSYFSAVSFDFLYYCQVASFVSKDSFVVIFLNARAYKGRMCCGGGPM